MEVKKRNKKIEGKVRLTERKDEKHLRNNFYIEINKSIDQFASRYAYHQIQSEKRSS